MINEETMPSESEWIIMEVFWERAVPLTAAAVIDRLQEKGSMTSKMVRVLLNRLCGKGLVSYTVDVRNRKVYHYFALKSREECQLEKSKRFADSFFAGSRFEAAVMLLHGLPLSREQVAELEGILKIHK